MDQLKQRGIKEVNRVPIQQLTDRELKHALTIARIREGA